MMALTGCQSSNQFAGAMTGSMLGGIFGSSIGGLLNGPRGSDAGNAIGMIIGGVAGAAVTAPHDGSRQKASRSDDYSYDEAETPSTSRRPAQSQQQSVESRSQALMEEYKDLTVEQLIFVDANHNRTIDAGERCKITFEIHNNGTETLYNIAPVLGVSDKKHILISPTAIVASLAPGKGVKYTAELIAAKNLKTGTADFSLGFAKDNLVYKVRTFQLSTYGG